MLPLKITSNVAESNAERADSHREGEPVAAKLERARQVAVFRQDRGKPRKIGEGGVRGENQDQRRRDLQRHPDRALAEHRPPHLREHRFVRRADAEMLSEKRQAR